MVFGKIVDGMDVVQQAVVEMARTHMGCNRASTSGVVFASVVSEILCLVCKVRNPETPKSQALHPKPVFGLQLLLGFRTCGSLCRHVSTVKAVLSYKIL